MDGLVQRIWRVATWLRDHLDELHETATLAEMAGGLIGLLGGIVGTWASIRNTGGHFRGQGILGATPLVSLISMKKMPDIVPSKSGGLVPAT